MTAPNHNHPDRSDLEAFGVGLLDPGRSAVVEKHVAGCESCCDALLQTPDDTLVRQLREAVTLPPQAAPAGPVPSGQDTVGHESAPADAPFEPPADLSRHPRYRLLKRLGGGGMGTVYLAEHGVMHRRVALKVIKAEYTSKPAAVERFQREIRAAAQLHHPNIVEAYDAEQAGDTHFLVMEYIDGVSLARLVAERGPLPVAEACEYVRQAALGLQRAHERGMVHRDVKPHNMIRTADGLVKVLDFGLASVVECREGQLTDTNVVMGTPDYIAPEQAEDTHAADARSDIYALGCTLYHLLTGRPPFTYPSTLLKLVAHREEAPAPVRVARPHVPEELAAVLSRMMAKAPVDRYQTAAEVAAALAPFADATALPRPRPKSRRRLWVAAAVAAVCMAGLAAAVAAVVVRIQTDQGEVTIQTDDPNIEVVVTKGGKLVRIVDPQSKQTWQLDPEKFELSMADQPDGLTITLDGKQPFVLKRKGDKLVTIARGPAQREEKVGEVFRRRWEANAGDTSWLTCGVDLSPDGRLLLSSHWRGVRVWEVSSGKLVQELNGSIARFTPDGTQIVAIARRDDAGNCLRLYDTDSGKLLRRFGPNPKGFWSLVMCPSGRTVATGGEDGILRLWDLTTGGLLGSSPPDSGLGPEYWGGKGDEVTECVKRTGNFIDYILPGGREGMGRNLVEGRAVPIYELSSGRLVRKIVLEGAGSINGVWTATDYGQRFGSRMAVSVADGTIYVLDLQSGKEVARFAAGNFQPKCLAISADDRFVAACAHDEKSDLVVWRLPDPPAEKPANAP